MRNQLCQMTAKEAPACICRPHGCPCGQHTNPTRECRCSPRQIADYRSRISGPLLDRIDIHIDVPSVSHRELSDKRSGTSSEEMGKLVRVARSIQTERFSGRKIYCNASMTSRDIKRFCAIDDASESLLRQAMQELALSARAYHKILKVARTIADIAVVDDIKQEHILEAIQYRSLDRQFVM